MISKIAEILRTVKDVGIVHEYERYSRDEKTLREFYSKDKTTINGFFIKRQSVREDEIGTLDFKETTIYKIVGFMSLIDKEASETKFNQMIDGIRNRFRALSVFIQTEEIEPVLFAGHLCHRCILSLEIKKTLEMFCDCDSDDFLIATAGFKTTKNAEISDLIKLRE